MRYRITHRTAYTYSEPVTVSHHASRVEARETPCQENAGSRLTITPEPAVRKNRRDYFGNAVCFFSVQELHERLDILAESLVRREMGSPPSPGRSPPWEEVVARLRSPDAEPVYDAQQFVFESPYVRPSADLAALAAPSFRAGRPLLEAILDLNRRIYSEFTYDAAATTVATPIEEVLRERRGVCQDFTHLALGCVRSMGLAGRYVSGYLRTRPAPGRPRLVGADATHAWLSVFCPIGGWVDFDPTNNSMPAAEHITVAFGRDFSDVSPVTGILVGGGEHRVTVAVSVEPDGD